MIFKETWQQVLDGTKTQTRRLVKPGDRKVCPPDEVDLIFAVERNGRFIWQRGGVYAVQPGRGKKAVGRIRITKIRRERLQQIGSGAEKREGFSSIHRFIDVWQSLYRRPYRWEDNPEVWILEFKCVESIDDRETN